MPFDYIILDTSVLRGAGWPRVSADLENLLQFARMLKIVVCVPQAVLLELEDFWRRGHQKRYDDARAAMAKIEKVAENPDLLPQLRIPTAEQQLADSMKQAEATRQKWDVEIIPITTKPVEDFLRMAAQKHPPFRNDGIGFKDAVIFFSAVEYLRGKKGNTKSGRPHIALIAPDTDFGDASLIKIADDAGVELFVVPSIEEMNNRITATLQQGAKNFVLQDQADALKALEEMRPEIEHLLNSQLEIPPSELFSFGLTDSFEVKHVKLISISNARTSSSPLTGDNRGPIKIAADMEIEIGVLASRTVHPEDSPIRVGQGWYPVLNVLSRMSKTKVETTNESITRTALLEAVGEKVGGRYTNLGQIAVALMKKSALYG